MTITEQLKEYLEKAEIKSQDTEFGLAIEYQGKIFLHIKNDPDHDNACRMLLNNIFDVTDENIEDTLVAINAVNSTYQWVKLMVVGEDEDSRVVVAFDWLCGEKPDFNRVFPEIFAYMYDAACTFHKVLTEDLA